MVLRHVYFHHIHKFQQGQNLDFNNIILRKI